jgi:hypothetical protein
MVPHPSVFEACGFWLILILERQRRKRMAEHIEDLQQRYAELKKRMELVRSFL